MTIKQLFPGMNYKQRSKLGMAIKESDIVSTGKVEEIHYVNSYPEDQCEKVILLAAKLFGNG